MNVLRMALLAILFFIAVSSLAQRAERLEAEDCLEFVVEMTEAPELAYARIAGWLAALTVAGDVESVPWYRALAASVEYALLSGSCASLEAAVGHAAGVDEGFVRLLVSQIGPESCDPVAMEIAESPELGFSRISSWWTFNLIATQDDGLIGMLPYFEPLAAALEYALLSGYCSVIEVVFRVVAEQDPVYGFLLTMGFSDDS